jgi:hypothetical protein
VSPSRALQFDVSRYPLVSLHVGPAYSSAEWTQMLADLIAIIKRGPFGLVVDLRNGQMPNAFQRRSFIAMYEDHHRLTRTHFLALGGVGESAILNRLITALNWLRPAPHPVRVFATLSAAESWVLDQLPAPVRQQVLPAKPEPKR